MRQAATSMCMFVLKFSYGPFVHSISLEVLYREKGLEVEFRKWFLFIREAERGASPSRTQLLRNERNIQKGEFYIMKSCELGSLG